MSEFNLSELATAVISDGPKSALESVAKKLEQDGDYHRLFDTKLMLRKLDLGLPLTQPTSFDDVPDELRKDFEKTYVDEARNAGELLLKQGKITDAFMYFRVINDTEPVARAIEELPENEELTDEVEELMNLAIYQQVNPVKGLRMMLKSHGICNTVTTLDQLNMQLSSEDRRKIAAVLVREIHGDVLENVKRDVEQRMAVAPPAESLAELVAGRDWLFENDNYHVDVSHLNSVTRFARSLDKDDPELPLAVDLAEYGSHLAAQLQYPGEPPFEDFYKAHLHYFNIILDQNREAGFDYFRQKLADEPDRPDKQLIAYVLVDLLARVDNNDEALPLAAEYLADLQEDAGFSFADFCRQVGRLDALQNYAESKNDVVTFVAAVAEQNRAR